MKWGDVLKNRKIFILLIILLIVFGLAFFTYPYISNWLFEKQSIHKIDTYEKEVNNFPQEVREAEWEKAKKYNEMLLTGNNKSMQEKYYSILNIGGVSMMGSIEIPDIKVKLPIYHGTGEYTLGKGVGHMEGTSLPIGGKGTHSFLTTHTGLPTAKLFTDLDKLMVSDVFHIRIMGEKLTYQVEEIRVVPAEETFSFAPSKNKDLVTLVTCTPYGINSHRLLVQGTRIHISNDLPVSDYKGNPYDMLWFIFLVLLAVLIMLFGIHLYKRVCSY